MQNNVTQYSNEFVHFCHSSKPLTMALAPIFSLSFRDKPVLNSSMELSDGCTQLDSLQPLEGSWMTPETIPCHE